VTTGNGGTKVSLGTKAVKVISCKPTALMTNSSAEAFLRRKRGVDPRGIRWAASGAPSTAVMTGNLTSSVLSLLDGLSRNQPLMEGPSDRWKKALMLVGGFFTGCVAGAGAVSLLGDWAWSLPVVLAATAVALH
jgi:hypothetical protein